jgi:hypothetical protein
MPYWKSAESISCNNQERDATRRPAWMPGGVATFRIYHSIPNNLTNLCMYKITWQGAPAQKFQGIILGKELKHYFKIFLTRRFYFCRSNSYQIVRLDLFRGIFWAGSLSRINSMKIWLKLIRSMATTRPKKISINCIYKTEKNDRFQSCIAAAGSKKIVNMYKILLYILYS